MEMLTVLELNSGYCWRRHDIKMLPGNVCCFFPLTPENSALGLLLADNVFAILSASFSK